MTMFLDVTVFENIGEHRTQTHEQINEYLSLCSHTRAYSHAGLFPFYLRLYSRVYIRVCVCVNYFFLGTYTTRGRRR